MEITIMLKCPCPWSYVGVSNVMYEMRSIKIAKYHVARSVRSIQHMNHKKSQHL